MEKVEWGTLVFFAGLFVLMELLAELGLINFIASVVVSIIEVTLPEKCLILVGVMYIVCIVTVCGVSTVVYGKSLYAGSVCS